MENPEEFVEEFLAHFGVKGMKWGVRRAANEANAAPEHKALTTTKQKAKSGGGTKALSNKDLQEAITRMNLEEQYNSLKAKQSKINKGLALVTSILGVTSKAQAVYNVGTTVAGAVKKAKTAPSS